MKPITIAIGVQFGRPCISGTGITTETIRSRFVGGDSMRLIGGDYALLQEQIEAALRFELAPMSAKKQLLEVAEWGPVEAHGKTWRLNPCTLLWLEVELKNAQAETAP